MSASKSHEWGSRELLLSFLLAALIWSSVLLERTGELKLQVPIVPGQAPAGLRVGSPLPGKLEVTVSGPRILLYRLLFCGASCPLDLSGAAAGTASFAPPESSFLLDRELKVVRISPRSVSLTLVGEASK